MKIPVACLLLLTMIGGCSAVNQSRPDVRAPDYAALFGLKEHLRFGSPVMGYLCAGGGAWFYFNAGLYPRPPVRTVAVAGSFDGWDYKNTNFFMAEWNGSGVWALYVPWEYFSVYGRDAKGRYIFNFIVNGGAAWEIYEPVYLEGLKETDLRAVEKAGVNMRRGVLLSRDEVMRMLKKKYQVNK